MNLFNEKPIIIFIQKYLIKKNINLSNYGSNFY